MSIDPELLLRLFIAAVLGSGIGLERELSGKPAGLRTHALICLGSCLFTVASIEGFAGPDWVDTSRVAAGVVTGIGFLGAGAIIRGDKGRIAGLTTASSIWAIAAIGIAIGAGMYMVGAVAAALSALILIIPKIKD